MRVLLLTLLLLTGFGVSPNTSAQSPKRTKKAVAQRSTPRSTSQAGIDTTLIGMLTYRNVGPTRGGRASCIAGVPGEPNLFYMGTAGGGVWRTEDGGRHWEPISDKYFGGTVGGLAVAPSDPNVIYAGGGEQTLRGNVSYGYGLWRSTNAGKTWTSLGLDDARHVGRIIVDPRDADHVYVAVMGDLYKASETRGVYESHDGGSTWKRILFANADAGAVDIAFDPYNPRTLYASTWRVRRTPHDFSSGGEGSALWRSTDSGATWQNLTAGGIYSSATSSSLNTRSAADKSALPRSAAGLPSGTLGIIGVAPSPAQRDRVWAIIEHKTQGGVYRSDDGGDHWQQVNDDRNLRQRAWYYSRIYAHPTDADQVYVLNVAYWHSKDGGKSFSRGMAAHSDHHDLWINPTTPRIMAIADDGGAQVTQDGGDNWTDYYNQPTAQFYRVTTDNHFPYRIYAAQQDNSTIRVNHRASARDNDFRSWEPTAGCECGHLAPKPDDPEIVYGGCYDGFLERVDHRTDLSRVVSVYPDNPMGHGAEGMKYRFQWNFPIFFSPHDPNKLYTASQHLHSTTNGGQTWKTISPDLTRNDSSRMVSSGGPITKDNTSVEYYCTIFAAGESPRVAGVLWTGSDDGRVHVSRDGGGNWREVTPPDLPEWTMINSLEVDPHTDGGCYLAATRYKLGDYQPYLYHTTDYGASWRRIDRGIDREHFTRVVRVDAEDSRLLYAGTESGVYVSLDGGNQWQAFQQNLPVVPVTDIALKDDDLIIATQGRALWILDDVAPVLRSMADGQDGVRIGNYAMGRQRDAVLMPTPDAYVTDDGVRIRFVLPDSFDVKRDTAVLAVGFAERLQEGDWKRGVKNSNSIVRVMSTHPDKEAKEEALKVKPGANEVTWNMRGADAERFEGMVLWWADMRGPRVPAGEYSVQLSLKPVSRPGITGQGAAAVNFSLKPDPRSPGGAEAIAERYRFHESVIGTVSEAHEVIKELRELRSQANAYLAKVDTADAAMQPLLDLGQRMDSTLTAVEEALYQTQNRSGQDPLNYPIRLTNKLASLNSMTQGEYRPTDGAYAVQKDIEGRIREQLEVYYQVRDEDVETFNRLVRELEVPALKPSTD